jgi:holo-[acyl-carrier protein] synthase
MQEMTETMSRDLPRSMRLGFDLVQVSQVAHSIEQFGAAFEGRLFTRDELAYAHAGAGVAAERLAARFAAKEAVIKALQLSNAGVGWRDIEVRKLDDGDCSVRLHGRAAAIARSRGVREILLSLSHDGDYAGAVATVFLRSDKEVPE